MTSSVSIAQTAFIMSRTAYAWRKCAVSSLFRKLGMNWEQSHGRLQRTVDRDAGVLEHLEQQPSMGSEERGEYQRLDRHKLDKDIQ